LEDAKKNSLIKLLNEKNHELLGNYFTSGKRGICISVLKYWRLDDPK